MTNTEKDKLCNTGLNLGDLNPGAVVEVVTRSRTYRIEYLGNGQARISGHPDYCPQPVAATIRGSTSRWSTLDPGFIGPGECLEFTLSGARTVRTSTIVGIHAGGTPEPPSLSSAQWDRSGEVME